MQTVQKLRQIRQQIPEQVRIVVVTKTQPVDKILDLYNNGHKMFGENKVQELVNKYEQLPADIEWHMIGHLQSNKVKYIAPFVHMIHSVDSLHILQIIDSEAKKCGRTIPCLLQIKIAREETKFGLSVQDAENLLGNEEVSRLRNIMISGLMGMATYTDDQELIRNEFKYLSSIFNMFQKKHFRDFTGFKDISMGMSHDYRIAIEEGATYIRIGTSVFGERNSDKIH